MDQQEDESYVQDHTEKVFESERKQKLFTTLGHTFIFISQKSQMHVTLSLLKWAKK